MDPKVIGALASSILAVLTPYLAQAGKEFAKEIGKMSVEKIGALYQVIKAHFQSRPAAVEALTDMEETPDDEDAQAALLLQLKKQMEADPAFADTLRQLVEEIGQDEQAATFLSQVYDSKVGILSQVYGSEVGKITNINVDRVDRLRVD
jgi:hypothetical protein